MCQASYPDGSEVTLSPFPAITSAFSGWSGDCAADPCQVTVNGDKTVTALFDLAQVRNSTRNTNYATLPAALATVAAGNELLLQAGLYSGLVTLNTGVNLNGGWDAAFGLKNGMTTLGSGLAIQAGDSKVDTITVKGVRLDIKGGSLRVKGVAVQP